MERKDTYYVPSLQQTVDAGEFANQRDVEIAALKKQYGKNNNAFIMGMRNLDQPISIGLFDRYIENKAKESGIAGSSVWEAVKGFGEGVGKAPAKYVGYFASNALPLIAKSATTLYAFSGAAGTKESADKFVREANKGIEAWAKEMQRITGIEDAGIVESTVGNALGSVSAGIMGGGFSAPMFGLSAAQDTYTRQREEKTEDGEEKVGIGEAALRGLWHGTGEWYLEKLQLNRILGALAKKSKPAAIIKDLLENALQEGAQQTNELAANWNVDKKENGENRDLIEKLQEIAMSMVGGAIASLAGSVGGNILNRKTINEVTDLMRRNGKSEEEVQKVKKELNKIVDTDELEQAAREVAKDELTTAALTFKEQAQAASEELVKGLEDTIARNELVDIGGEIQGWKTEEMKPMYQLGELQIDTQKNPHLGMVLYQAEQAGQPMETLAQVLEWTKGKLDTEEAQKLATGIGSVYTKTFEQLKGFGQDDKLADSNARIRAGMAFSLAKNFNMTVEKADEMLGGIESKKFKEFSKPTTDTNGQLEFNMVSAKDPEAVKMRKELLVSKGLTEKEADNRIAQSQEVYDAIIDLAKQKGYLSFLDWNKRELEFYTNQQGLRLPTLPPFINNNEYDYNMDLGATCTKREALDAAFAIADELGVLGNVGAQQIEEIKDLLRRRDFMTACSICFVDTKRVDMNMYANRIAFEWDTVLKAIGINDNKMMGTERKLTQKQQKILEMLANKDKMDKNFEKYIPKEARRNDKEDYGITADKMVAIAKVLLDDTSGRMFGKIDPAWFLTTKMTDWMESTFASNERWRGFLGGAFGVAMPKPNEGWRPYTTLGFNGLPVSSVEKLFEIGGFRFQSFTDFSMKNVLDYIQFLYDLTDRGYPLHGYTKVPGLIQIAGNSGAKINMSLIFDVLTDVDDAHAGLRPATEEEVKSGKDQYGYNLYKDDSGVWAYAFHSDSFPVDKAIMYRKGYLNKDSMAKGKKDIIDGNIGTIGVGLSDAHIKAMLRDKNIDMVIPYHASSIKKEVAEKYGLNRAVDYSKYQITKLNGKKVNEYFNKIVREEGDPKKAAETYKNKYKLNGKIKFEQFADEENYYKLLEDFRLYDEKGNYAPQTPVNYKPTPNMLEYISKGLAYREDVEAKMKELKNDKEFVDELKSILGYQKADKQVRDVLVKKLQGTIGKENVVVLGTEKFNEAVKDALVNVYGKEKALKKHAILRASNGVIYGFAENGKIVLNENRFNANTPAHEFTHVWARVAKAVDPKLWNQGKELIKKTKAFRDVLRDPSYSDLKNEDDQVSEALARIVGRENERFVKKMYDPSHKEYKEQGLINKIMEWFVEMFNKVRSLFDMVGDNPITYEEFIHMPLKDLWDDTRSKEFKAKKKVAYDMSKYDAGFQVGLEMMTGYVSMRNPLVGTQLDADAHYGEGEHGNMAHGWGNYLLLDREKNKERYYDNWNKKVEKTTYDGKSIEVLAADNGVRFSMMVAEVANKAKYISRLESNTRTVTKEDKIEAQKRVLEKYESYLHGDKTNLEYEKEQERKGFANKVEHFEEEVRKDEEKINIVKNMDLDKLKTEEVSGTAEQHEFDIPEKTFLLNEDASLDEQPVLVEEALEELNQKEGKAKGFLDSLRTHKPDSKITGYDIYNKLAQWSPETDFVKEARWASKQLESVGIKGIYYRGGIDGEGVVIFNKEDTKHIQRLLQEQSGKPLGAYYNNTVYLFENANESTFIHEMSHAYMDVLDRLAQSGNAKAQKDLDTIRKWLKKKDGEAFTQADWERFARGFEMYVREGKAPNEYLGGKDGVFARFRNWLLGIYGGMKALTVKNEKGKNEPVRINNQIRQFYNEMLGGADIDQVLNNAIENKQAMSVVENKLKELAEIQQKLAEERAKLVREMAKQVKPETTWGNVKDWGNNLWESITELPKELLKSSSERLAKIDPRLGMLVQRVEQSQGLRLKEWADQLKPFYEAFNKLSADDKAKVQFYLLNQQWGDVADLLGEESTDAVRSVLEGIYQDLIDSGVEVGYRYDYFPRAVLDYDGLLKEMGLTYPSLRKEMEAAIGKNATPQEQAEWLDKHIMQFKGNVSLNKNRNTKERKLDLITPSMAQYYKPSMDTLVDYLTGMAKLLSMREAFGRDMQAKEDDVGKIIESLFGTNKLTKKETDEITRVLNALFMPSAVGNKFIQAMRQYGYATKLSFSTTVRQFADIGMMMKVNGVLNTLDALFHPDKRLSLETLGIDPLGEEFRTSDKDIGGRIANLSTKFKGINWADAVMKNAFIRGNYKSLQKLAKDSNKFHEKYDRLFGEETETIRQDLLADKVSEPVKVLLFHEISKIQPISRSAMPTAYLNNPNGRVFYMFKTFSLHRAEYMVSELAEDFRRGDYKKAGKDIMADVAVIGWEGLVELLIAFLKYGWAALAGEQVLETFAGSGLGVLGLNKHQAVQLAHGKVGDFFREMIGVGTPFDDIGYLIQHYDDDDKLLRAFLPDMIIEPLIAGPKEIK